MRVTFLLLSLVAGAAAAQSPDDFAWQWPLQAVGGDGAHVVTLDEAVYERLARPDLRDLVVFNADGQAVPFAPLPVASRSELSLQALPWMRVASADTRRGDGDRFTLQLERDADGTLRDLRIDSQGTRATGAAADLLVDLGADPIVVSSLRVTPGPGARGGVNLRVAVHASDDLAGWRPLGRDLALVSLEDGGLNVERLRLDFSPSRERYLRLSLEPGADWPALERIESEAEHIGQVRAPARELRLEGEPIAGQPGSFSYRLPGPLPVEAWDLQPAAPNTVASVAVETRDDDARETPWRHLARATVFRLGSGDGEVRQLPVDIATTRDRLWQVHTQPALAAAPTLVLRWRPDRFVLLAQPPAPYTLHAGSARASRPDYPVQAALAAAAGQRPPGWEPPAATIGEGRVAAGDAVLRPDRGPDYRRWALWAVLAVAGLLVLVMALRVLRHPPADDVAPGA